VQLRSREHDPIEAVEVIPIVVPDQARDDLDGTVETVIVKVIDAEVATASARRTRRPAW
jgi:hypothetical protein